MSDIVVTCHKHGELTIEESYRNSMITLASGESKHRYICKICSKNAHSKWARKKYAIDPAFRQSRKESQQRYLAKKRLKEKS